MSNIFSLLAVKKTELQTGTIEGKTQNGIIVRIGKESITMQTATAESLPIGSKVVIGQAGDKKYIIGKEKSFTENILEVRIHG